MSSDHDKAMNFARPQFIPVSMGMLPAAWMKYREKYLKPCYAKIYSLCRAAGHPVYMHCDGHIYEIIPDLIECGVNVINPQFRANGLDNLARVCKGNVCVDLDLDRQLFPFCTPADIDAHVRVAVEILGSPEGGLWLKAEIDDGVPLEIIEAKAASRVAGYVDASPVK
jgi:uroporphyrinogen decarboxylase